jgi:hypothetical protein
MGVFLNKYHFLRSRKFWAALAAWLALLITCLQTEPFPVETFVNGTVAIALGYIGGVAFEDGMAKKDAGKTTIATDAPNVSIETAEAKPTPPVGRMGL